MMPTYEFESCEGERIERYYPVSRAPRVGSQITVGGVRYRRVYSTQTRPVCRDERHIAHTLPRKNKAIGFPDHPADHLGRYLFTGKQERVEFEAKLKDRGIQYAWD